MLFSDRPPSRSFELGIYAVVVVLLSAAATWSASALSSKLIGMIDAAILDGSGQVAPEKAGMPVPAVTAEAPVSTTSGAVVPLSATRAPTQPQWPSSGSFENDVAAAFHNGREGTYRTYCVRLCDGYFWPISFSTTADRLERDKSTCEASCGSPARLFVHAMPGGSAATMTTLDGLPYTALKTAFLFRSRFDSQCKCHAHPWEQQAVDQHRLYAATEAARTGSKAAAAKAATLRSKLAAAKLAETQAKLSETREADRTLAELARTVERKPVPVASRMALPRQMPLARVTAEPPPGMMGLGASEPQRPSRSGWRAGSGTSRRWQERAFGGQ